MKRAEAAEVVLMLLAAYPNAKLNPGTSAVYETMLGDLDAATARAAVQGLIATSRFLPTISEIREAALAIGRGPVRSGCDAWLDIVGEIRRVGTYAQPRFADPITTDIVRRWGWRALCDSSNEAADRARFIEVYDALAIRERRDALALPATARTQELPQ